MTRGAVILGIDPGLANVGFGVITSNGMESSLVEYGTVRTKAGEPSHERLLHIFHELRKVAEKAKPDYVAIETLYFAKNTKSAMDVAQARGVALAAIALDEGVIVREITPLQIKQAMTGYGRADKAQIQRMTQMLLHLDDVPRPDHAADALGVALTCAHTLRRRR